MDYTSNNVSHQEVRGGGHDGRAGTAGGASGRGTDRSVQVSVLRRLFRSGSGDASSMRRSVQMRLRQLRAQLDEQNGEPVEMPSLRHSETEGIPGTVLVQEMRIQMESAFRRKASCRLSFLQIEGMG